ncbi:hypothetical protein BLA60_37245 [Actinophytocola xinjiangensis]|uniref:Peptidase S8/S53 domain-containing protein n=1 Tax=Actinophytocola xinjiangensis TaxID=485602 RepID=A0A7Z1AVE0_9PSEU|nr:hypothetical protein BLA60_37245 [Actinophytocola xinjiangensis]
MAAVAVTALAWGALAVPPVAAAQPPEPPAAAPQAAQTAGPDRTWTVTLITGDRVRLTESGGRYTATAEPARRPNGHQPVFDIRSSPERILVVPDDARAAVDAGVLDRSLFDVTYLARNGYADDSTGDVPVIVRYDRAARAFATAQALPASDATLPLPSVRGAALTVDKTAAGEFWAAIDSDTTTAPAARSLSGGISQVWLDRKVTATLADTVPLIGAPQAWAAGLDGTGATVAVLDTGVDAAHPDLAGKIAASASFIPGEEVADGHGHGTHVASTVAGIGAAKGVAPGASLVIGKVLSNAGEGADSSVIAGMEWAATEMDADVVSMSLGADPTDGTDPLAMAVESLSASSGALFVIAAGNTGPGKETVSTPGTADSALTVAATSKTDTLADFSSRGPRTGDGALKPDLAAPGVDVVAARAAGTALGTPVDDRYTSASGTSMATPHVAGAAAILAQAHPDWSGQRIKAALMSTAKDTGHTVYETGAGRVDLARATAQQVTATTVNVDFGVIPEDVNDTASRDVTYANAGDTDVTLDLAPALRRVGGDDASGSLSAPASVTVPAGDSATVSVTLDPAGLGKGNYSGALVATAGDTRVSTPVGLGRGAKKVVLTVNTLGFDGKPAPPPIQDGRSWGELIPTVSAADVEDVYFVEGTFVAPGIRRYLVEPGTYSVTHNLITTTRELVTDMVYLVNPEVKVTGDTEITLDARDAVPVEFRTPRPTDSLHILRNVVSSHSAWNGLMAGNHLTGRWSGRTWVTPTQRVTTGKYLFNAHVTLTNPQVSMRTIGRGGFDLDVTQFARADEGVTSPDVGMPIFPDGKQRRELVPVNLARPDDIAKVDLRGKVAVQRMDPNEPLWEGHSSGCVITDERTQWLRDAGAVGVLFYVDTPDPGCVGYFFDDEDSVVALPLARLSQASGERLAARLADGPVTVEITGHPETDYTYQLSEFVTQRVPRSMTFEYGRRDLATVESSFHTADNLGRAKETWHTWRPEENFSASSFDLFAAPSKRTVYFGGMDPETLWSGAVELPGGAAPVKYSSFREPTTSTARWGAAPLTPGAAAFPRIAGLPWHDSCSMCRLDDVFVALYQHMQSDDISGNYGGYLNLSSRLYRDGKELPKTQLPGLPPDWPVYTLPAEPATYRLTQTHDNTSSAWTFRSGRVSEHTVPSGQYCPPALFDNGEVETPCAPQPLVFAGYDFGDSQDLTNRVAAGGKRDLLVRAYHSVSTGRMPAIGGVRLWYSTDDGRTWKVAKLRGAKEPGTYRATLDLPALKRTSGAVSLKVEAWDTAGNRLDQTTTRAVTLK